METSILVQGMNPPYIANVKLEPKDAELQGYNIQSLFFLEESPDERIVCLFANKTRVPRFYCYIIIAN